MNVQKFKICSCALKYVHVLVTFVPKVTFWNSYFFCACLQFWKVSIFQRECSAALIFIEWFICMHNLLHEFCFQWMFKKFFFNIFLQKKRNIEITINKSQFKLSFAIDLLQSCWFFTLIEYTMKQNFRIMYKLKIYVVETFVSKVTFCLMQINWATNPFCNKLLH